MTSNPAKVDAMAAAPPRSDDVPSLKTLPGIARILRGMTAETGAKEFVLCLADSRVGAPPLACVMDAAYPGTSPAARRFIARLPSWLVARASASPIPLWWKGSDGTVAGLDTAQWAERVELASAAPGLLLPLCTERGQQGLLVFSGGAIAVDPARLTEMHARCFGLFGVVADTWPRRNRSSAPSVSKRELECLKLTASGHTSEEISRLLGLSVHTTNQYLTNTTQKLNAVNRVHAVAKAIREGLIG